MDTMKAIIIGHGPSLLGAKKGQEIDSFDAVIRLKWGYKSYQVPDSTDQDYGIKTDYLLSTFRTWAGYKEVKVKEYWGYENVFCGRNMFLISQQMASPIWVDYEGTKYWLAIYNSMRTWGLPHVSTGLAAVWYACRRLELESLTIAGYDNTIAGTSAGYKSVWRNLEYKYPQHRWDLEHDMLPLITAKYGVKLCVL